MLVLSRKKDQEIIVADGLIEFKIVDIRGDVVKIGITAPKEIRVDRREVWEAIKRESAKFAACEKSDIIKGDDSAD